MDEILGGGLPRNRTYLVQGDPGTGKTTLGLQFLLAGAARGEKGVYVSLSETKQELIDVALSHGWSLDGIELHELSAAQQMFQAQARQTVFEPAEVELSETTRALLDAVNRNRPTLVVLDSLSEMQLLAGERLRFRQQILAIKQYFSQHQCTLLLLDDQTVMADDRQLQSIANGVIRLDLVPQEFGADRRRLRVAKVRGITFRAGYHDYVIRTGGLEVFPRLVAAEHRHEVPQATVSSGISGLDSLLCGGLPIGTSTLIVGPAGAGKSSICFQYAYCAAERGENVMVCLFDERPPTFLTRAKGLGMDPTAHIEGGRMVVKQIDPAELSSGEFVQMLRDSVTESNTRMIVIDSLDGYLKSMPGERFMSMQLHELLSYLGQMSVTSFLTTVEHGLFPGTIRNDLDLSYLSDTVLLLRYFEYEGEIHHALSCLKKRSGNHEKTIRELWFTPKGLVIGRPLKGFRGIMTGMPIRENGASDGK